jgi:hypothetical protein
MLRPTMDTLRGDDVRALVALQDPANIRAFARRCVAPTRLPAVVELEDPKIRRRMTIGALPASKGFVYVGETSLDIDVHRDQLRRSLVHRRYTVLPQAPLRLRNGPETDPKTRSR